VAAHEVRVQVPGPPHHMMHRALYAVEAFSSRFHCHWQQSNTVVVCCVAKLLAPRRIMSGKSEKPVPCYSYTKSAMQQGTPGKKTDPKVVLEIISDGRGISLGGEKLTAPATKSKSTHGAVVYEVDGKKYYTPH
jgi:hypothetical protein